MPRDNQKYKILQFEKKSWWLYCNQILDLVRVWYNIHYRPGIFNFLTFTYHSVEYHANHRPVKFLQVNVLPSLSVRYIQFQVVWWYIFLHFPFTFLVHFHCTLTLFLYHIYLLRNSMRNHSLTLLLSVTTFSVISNFSTFFRLTFFFVKMVFFQLELPRCTTPICIWAICADCGWS